MADPYTPLLFGVSVAPAGMGTIDFTLIGKMHASYIKNSGDTSIAINFTGTPPAAATIANGRHILRANQAINIDDMEYEDISYRAGAGGASAELEVVALPRPGSSGQGAS